MILLPMIIKWRWNVTEDSKTEAALTKTGYANLDSKFFCQNKLIPSALIQQTGQLIKHSRCTIYD